MRLSTCAAIALWTMLAGPVFHDGRAGWGARCSGPVGSTGIVQPPAENVQIEGQPAGYWQLGKGGYQYRHDVNGAIVGAYDPDQKLWWPLIDGEYREEFSIPYDRSRLRDDRNKGLILDKLSTARERVSIGGKAVTLGEGLEALGSHEVPAFSRMPRVTAIVRDANWRKKIETDFLQAPELAALRGKVLFDVYDPAHWHVQPFGLERSLEFQTSGLALLFQGPPAPDGRAKPYAMWSYPGPAAVAAAAEGLRTPAPGYDPTKIAPIAKPWELSGNLAGYGLLAAGVLVLLLLLVLRARSN